MTEGGVVVEDIMLGVLVLAAGRMAGMVRGGEDVLEIRGMV